MMETQMWTEYQTGKRVRDRTALVVSLWANGIFRLNAAAYTAMGKPPAVRLFFNRAERALALVPANIGDQNARGFRRLKSCESHILSALGFCKQFDIVPEKATVFDRPKQSVDGTLTLYLPATAAKDDRQLAALGPTEL